MFLPVLILSYVVGVFCLSIHCYSSAMCLIFYLKSNQQGHFTKINAAQHQQVLDFYNNSFSCHMHLLAFIRGLLKQTAYNFFFLSPTFLDHLHLQLSNRRGHQTSIRNIFFKLFSHGSFNSPLCHLLTLSTHSLYICVCFKVCVCSFYLSFLAVMAYVLWHICSIKHHTAGSERH